MFDLALFGLVGWAHEARGAHETEGLAPNHGWLAGWDRGVGPDGTGGPGIKTGESGGCICKVWLVRLPPCRL